MLAISSFSGHLRAIPSPNLASAQLRTMICNLQFERPEKMGQLTLACQTAQRLQDGQELNIHDHDGSKMGKQAECQPEPRRSAVGTDSVARYNCYAGEELIVISRPPGTFRPRSPN
jgi:hypothetical protein